MYHTHVAAFDTNYEEPYSHTYTPNGNFNKANLGSSIGSKLIRKEVSADQYIAAFIVDIDRKSHSHPNAPELSRKDVLEVIKRENLPIQYITETDG